MQSLLKKNVIVTQQAHTHPFWPHRLEQYIYNINAAKDINTKPLTTSLIVQQLNRIRNIQDELEWEQAHSSRENPTFLVWQQDLADSWKLSQRELCMFRGLVHCAVKCKSLKFSLVNSIRTTTRAMLVPVCLAPSLSTKAP